MAKGKKKRNRFIAARTVKAPPVIENKDGVDEPAMSVEDFSLLPEHQQRQQQAQQQKEAQRKNYLQKQQEQSMRPVVPPEPTTTTLTVPDRPIEPGTGESAQSLGYRVSQAGELLAAAQSVLRRANVLRKIIAADTRAALLRVTEEVSRYSLLLSTVENGEAFVTITAYLARMETCLMRIHDLDQSRKRHDHIHQKPLDVTERFSEMLNEDKSLNSLAYALEASLLLIKEPKK